MTNLIIHTDVTQRRNYLLKKVNELHNKNYTLISQLYSNPDIHIIEHPQHVSIKIEDVKALMKEMQFKPFQATSQIGIIFHSSNMTPEAQNAILKTLEEQSESTEYFLLVSNEKSLLPTILSRSIKHYVKTDHEFDSDEEVTQILKPEILTKDLLEKFEFVENLVEEDKETKGSIQGFLELVLKYYSDQIKIAVIDGKNHDIESIVQKIEAVEVAQEQLRANVNKRLLLENLFLSIEEIS